ncbi:MAG: protein kinase, partial [Anaerolineae bacterium]|nr:protein kinase [Anaerolineae bacterium]
MDPGAIIKDQYKVVEHIGRGGMADVWSARDVRLRRMVAIKTIARGLSADIDPVALFEKEAQTIAGMEHPHILPIYDFGDYEGSLYIVMRFVTGGSLEQVLRQGPMPLAEVLKMGEAIARALDYAHENNIIHLDLKPPNILLGSGQTPYLADFGLATVLDVEGRARNPGSGTLLYMAPEQIVAETIDRRADTYAFAIMLFHMLTGQLPFEGEIPLALAQMQFGRTLPEVDSLNPALPYALSDVLRRGTAQNPADRPATLLEMIDTLREIVSPAATLEVWAGEPGLEDEVPAADLSPAAQDRVSAGDAELLEAVDLYTRARYQWAGGQGRFLLGVSHFMLMSGYYQNAAEYDLPLDDAGREMLLRGALEYDFETEVWWALLNDESRRRVCFHALRSLNTPARIRAMYRLETLPDDPATPQIPRLVSQALEIEQDSAARIAALKVLTVRARLLKPRQKVQIQSAYQGRLLTSMTRLGIQILPPSVWQEAVYSPEIDLLIAENALDTEADDVAEAAARAIGQMRSLTAVRHIAAEQRRSRAGSLQALALIRDEAPALPDVVSRQGRSYAWLTNTARRLLAQPLETILRFVLVLLGGWIGMGELVYVTFRSQALFAPQRWGNAIAIGLVFGLFVALTALLADEFSRRLDRFWQWWMRLLVFGLAGYLMGTLTYGAFTWLYLQYVPDWGIMRLAGFALAAGFVLSPLLRLPAPAAVLLTTALAFLPVFALYRNFYFGQYFSVTPLAPIGLLFGVLVGWRTRQQARPGALLALPLPGGVRHALSAAGGLLWATGTWALFALLFSRFLEGGALTWDGVLALFLLNTSVGALVAYFVSGPRLLTFVLAGLAAGLAYELTAGWWLYTAPALPGLLDRLQFFLASGGWQLYTSAYVPPAVFGWPVSLVAGVPFAPLPGTPIFYLDPPQLRLNMVFTVGVPLLLTIALGANFMGLVRGWLAFIGRPLLLKERPAWLSALLVLTLFVTALMSVLALFSLHVSVPWALGWSLWAFWMFVMALATWRFARWGGRGLAAGAVLLLVGGFLADALDIVAALNAGLLPGLAQMQVIPLHPGYVPGSESLARALT